ncbi:MAG UNVERIFIED_CONTAM: winged helix-turn-helix domain-containing protein [Planctomycetaceae bacterium]|jgi:hypothetical protein
MPRLIDLPAGTRFRVPELDIIATLLMVNECRARVRIDQGSTVVEFTDPNGERRSFNARRIRETSWASTMWVEVLSFTPCLKGKRPWPRRSVSPKTKLQPPQPHRQRSGDVQRSPEVTATAGTDSTGAMSQLDAAARVLQETGGTMNTKQMVEVMAERGYWRSPGGKTPHSTLYSAILRELQTKGDGSRFLKAERGQFSLRNT